MTHPNARIEATGLQVRLGGKPVLRGVDFAASAGAFTAIIGPNGSGKTTLLRTLTGDLLPGGSVTINGVELNRLKPWQRACLLAVLPQATVLAFPFTVREVVGLGLLGGRSGIAGTLLPHLPDRALEAVDLAGFAGRFYQELSGGEQQRVQLARVLCQVWEPVLDGQPRWLFLDEPVSSLDIRHQIFIMQMARNYARRGGGVIAVMHDLNLTALFADRVQVMHAGRTAASGTPDAVLNDAMLARVFGCDLKVGAVPRTGTVFVLPHSAVGRTEVRP